jgi:hypothetical protein
MKAQRALLNYYRTMFFISTSESVFEMLSCRVCCAVEADAAGFGDAFFFISLRDFHCERVD